MPPPLFPEEGTISAHRKVLLRPVVRHRQNVRQVHPIICDISGRAADRNILQAKWRSLTTLHVLTCYPQVDDVQKANPLVFPYSRKWRIPTTDKPRIFDVKAPRQARTSEIRIEWIRSFHVPIVHRCDESTAFREYKIPIRGNWKACVVDPYLLVISLERELMTTLPSLETDNISYDALDKIAGIIRLIVATFGLPSLIDECLVFRGNSEIPRKFDLVLWEIGRQRMHPLIKCL